MTRTKLTSGQKQEKKYSNKDLVAKPTTKEKVSLKALNPNDFQKYNTGKT